MFMGWSLPNANCGVQYRQRTVPAECQPLSWAYSMQLPDEAITYTYQGLLQAVAEDWTPAAELRGQHFLAAAKVRDLTPRLMQIRSQVAAERELRQVPPGIAPLDACFIDLPPKTLDQQL